MLDFQTTRRKLRREYRRVITNNRGRRYRPLFGSRVSAPSP
ncbi:hypothetical protein PAMC26577_15920 [Caballeronia sordidicola]|uniref:Uncharacterized protein n=1 Tax=Caballeronia sordidicola TaxID=196367 RepID=A0A242MSP5_CABSO|nr:hypothetical protein PAMC26577_15920 [Caballeronia sordidicola]